MKKTLDAILVCLIIITYLILNIINIPFKVMSVLCESCTEDLKKKGEKICRQYRKQ